MGTRCRGLGEIRARLTGPVRGQVATRVQITERKPIIPQMSLLMKLERFVLAAASLFGRPAPNTNHPLSVLLLDKERSAFKRADRGFQSNFCTDVSARSNIWVE